MRTMRRTCFSTCSTTRRVLRRVRPSRSSRCCRRPVSRFGSEMLRRTFAHWTRMGAVLAGLASLLTACEIGTVTVPKTEADVVVHAVLNPSATMQVVLLERTLSGAANVPDTTFDGTDPIASAGGIPISGATVEILDSLGRTFRGVEDQIGT